ncbi:MAG TPA: hypothetical protein DHW49_13790 [Anaerolineae bacterium]|nr:hypothetical protein [Anaerolineae bacterium]
MNLLIPYIQLPKPDPVLDEFTYGDVNQRARKLKSLRMGDYVFFHTSWGGKRYITSYFIVNRVLNTSEVVKDKLLNKKYVNPHISDYKKSNQKNREDVILFGDPITSRVLDVPLLFDSRLVKKLSLNVKFLGNHPEMQDISSATRAWRELTTKDVNILLKNINIKKKTIKRLMSSEEVSETIEKDIEDFIAKNPILIGKGLKLINRQLHIESGIVDLLFEDKKNNITIVEVKLNRVGRDAIQQIQRYLQEFREREKNKKIHGVIVCSGVMPAYEKDIRKQKKIQILTYGWDMKVQSWK